MLTLKLFPNRTLTQTLTQTPILNAKTANEKSWDEYFSFCFIFFNLKIFGEIVTTYKKYTFRIIIKSSIVKEK